MKFDLPKALPLIPGTPGYPAGPIRNEQKRCIYRKYYYTYIIIETLKLSLIEENWAIIKNEFSSPMKTINFP